MKILIKILKDFIEDFNIKEEDGVICFASMLYFSSKNYTHHLPTEVQIITIEHQHIDVLYFLNPNVGKFKIPDMLPVTNDNFIYVKDKALVALGDKPPYGQYTLSIHPGNQPCHPDTLKELHAKVYN